MPNATSEHHDTDNACYEGSCGALRSAGSEVWDLAWSVLDGVATEKEVIQLRTLVESEAQARADYLSAVRLDADLALLFRDRPQETDRPWASNSPIVMASVPLASPPAQPA